MLNSEDIKYIKRKGITIDMVKNQLERFEKGFPFLKIEDSASIGNGITKLTDNQIETCISQWNEFLLSGGIVEKFVPASGAASRMFKDLFSFMNGNNENPTTNFEKKFFDQIEKFAFYDDLNATCEGKYGKSITALKSENKHIEIVRCLLTEVGLNYGALPKGLLKFHKMGTKCHSPLEEHLEEGAQYAKDKNGRVNIHFTVSPEHRAHFEALIAKKLDEYEKEWGVKYNLSLSEQKPSTDTIAVDMENMPYRENGELLFRPAGHGALIENLNDLEADVVFIKNIDNVVPTNLREDTIKFKKVIGGYLILIQCQIDKYLKMLESGEYSIEDIREMIKFMHDKLNIRYSETKHLEDCELVIFIKNKFNRPIRVCGMVRNDGEPGGGPYIVYNADGTTSPQILESSQFDKNSPKTEELIKKGTHFNPVDLVCYIKDIHGKKFNLKDYVDPDTGLISEKSKNGTTIKALELPGLWNGSMSDWNTVFVDVPISTFNPVKTVNDLLRDQHHG